MGSIADDGCREVVEAHDVDEECSGHESGHVAVAQGDEMSVFREAVSQDDILAVHLQ